MNLPERTQIAAMVLAGLLANPHFTKHEKAASLAVQKADELIKLLGEKDDDMDDWGT